MHMWLPTCWTRSWSSISSNMANGSCRLSTTPVCLATRSASPRELGRTVACTCQVCVACTCRVSVACAFSVSIYAWDSQQLAGSKVVLSRDHVVQKKKLLKLRSCRWSYEVVGGDQFSSWTAEIKVHLIVGTFLCICHSIHEVQVAQPSQSDPPPPNP